MLGIALRGAAQACLLMCVRSCSSTSVCACSAVSSTWAHVARISTAAETFRLTRNGRPLHEVTYVCTCAPT